MIENLDYATLQHLWWLICAVVGSLFLFLTFVQGGQTLLWQVAKTDVEKSLIINSLGFSSFKICGFEFSNVISENFVDIRMFLDKGRQSFPR